MEIYDPDGVVIMSSNSQILRFVMNVTFPALGYGAVWTFYDSKITTRCVAFVLNFTIAVICYNGYLQVRTLPPGPGYSGNATSGGSLKLFKI